MILYYVVTGSNKKIHKQKEPLWVQLAIQVCIQDLSILILL